MIGFQRDNQKRLFYSFNLEDHVPQNHLLRSINQHLDLTNLRQHLAEYYSHTGTIPYTGGAAWNSLFVESGLRAENNVVLLGPAACRSGRYS
ncbi:hypothetical protein GALL_82100 [mine drainage metagenome]|uniref:Transposase InsH N-terminal domain-containing protein n=1 Tax=mine drainage metagenome TaxID=410659 RepID=A0A1J5T7L3_9ZZZZ